MTRKKRARKIKARVGVINSQVESMVALLSILKDTKILTAFKSEYLKLTQEHSSELLSLKDYEKRIFTLVTKYSAKVE
jgi:hypothetical protein